MDTPRFLMEFDSPEALMAFARARTSAVPGEGAGGPSRYIQNDLPQTVKLVGSVETADDGTEVLVISLRSRADDTASAVQLGSGERRPLL